MSETMNQKEAELENRAVNIIELLDVKFTKKREWSEPRCQTTWGTKTRKGLIESLKRLMTEEIKMEVEA